MKKNFQEEKYSNGIVDIGGRIRDFRVNHLKVTQVELANHVNVSKSFISYVEKGEKKPSFELLYFLSKKFNANLKWIFTGEGKALDQDFNGATHKPLEDRFPAINKSPEIVEFLENLNAPILYHAFMAWYLKIIDEIEPQIQEYFTNIEKKEKLNGGSYE